MENNKWLFEQCLKCRHLITKTNMRTGDRTYACDEGSNLMMDYGAFKYVGDNGVIIPTKNGESVCDSYVERFIISSNEEENGVNGRD